MIYSVNGTLIHIEPGVAVVECGGVGLKCLTSMGTLRTLPQVGEKVKLYTQLNVREDAMDLFGFATRAELNCFRMLTAVSGVGPRVGLAILSELSPEQVALAVAAGDSKTLSRANGVGPKLAQRIALELKDKVKKMGAPGAAELPPAQGMGGVPSAAGNAANAVSALAVLGYTPAEAAAVVAQFDSALPTEELIRLSLKAMGSKF
ncbi:MAG TPA: Holliday junction branch migration protein RuvA [Candidatus Caccousia avistercoris]|nr:Holliday junction branch migration protein RuvA [Candidatus Caccousia avistercoris]